MKNVALFSVTFLTITGILHPTEMRITFKCNIQVKFQEILMLYGDATPHKG